MSLRDRALRAQCKTERIRVPEWADDETGPDGPEVIVSEISAADRARLTAQVSKGRWDDFYADIVIAGLIDPETNQPAFTREDRPLINKMPTMGLERISTHIRRLSGLQETSIEDAEKN